jgi:hypothetical protein
MMQRYSAGVIQQCLPLANPLSSITTRTKKMTTKEKMRRLKNSVFHLQSRISSLHKALSILIDDDESMAFMNLTKLKKDPGLYR